MPTDRTLYVVVHGVGDPDPGETTRDLARGLTAARQSGEVVAVTEERLWVPEPDPAGGAPPRLTRAFLVPVFRNDARGRLLAEVNWADLSRFPVSLFGLFEGLVGLLFGLRHVAAAASAGCGYKSAAALRGLGRTVAFLLIGPLAASNVLMLFLLVAAVVADQIEAASFAGPGGVLPSQIACGLAVAAGALLGWLLRRHEVYRWLFRSLAVIALVVLAVALALQSAGRSTDIWGWGEMGDLLRALPPKPGEAGSPAEKSTGGVVFYAAVAVFPMAAAFVGASLAAFFAVVVYAGFLTTRPDQHARRSALVAALLPFAMLFGWSVLIPFAWVVSGVLVSSQSWLSGDFKAVYHALLDFLLSDLPLIYLGLVLVVVAALVALVVWQRKKPDDDEDKRLIVASLILGALAVNAVLLPLMFVYGLIKSWPEWLNPNAFWTIALRFIALALPFAPLVLKVAFPRLRNVLDLVFDVATHFRPRSDSWPGSPDEFPIRAAVQRRVTRVVAYFADQAKAATGEDWHLVVVCHSQGTMAVLEWLDAPDTATALNEFKTLRLVTMGSPFGHIYQHYFHHLYPPLGDARWGTLRTNITAKPGNRWLNVYRVDDYVGRKIEEPKPAGTKLVENKPVQFFGHTNYWSDGVVMGVLVAEGIF